MTAGLETFAKVRTLHDRTSNPGEKAAAAGRMEALAKAAGMTVKQATSKLDAKPKAQPAPPPPASNFFNDLFNTPEFKAERAERERSRQAKAARLVEEYGSEDAVFADTPLEAALRAACEPLLGPGETWNTIYRLDGWDGYGAEKMPASVREAVTEAWPLPETVAAAWAEYEAAERLLSDRYVVEYHYTPHSFTDARRYVVEGLCNTLPARSLNDLRARLSWMEFWANSEISQPPKEHRATLTTLRADIERMGAQIRQGQGLAQSANPPASPDPASATGVQNGHAAPDTDVFTEPGENLIDTLVLSTPDPGTSNPVQNGQAKGGSHYGHPLRRMNADKRRDVLALLRANTEKSGISPLSDREIARRAGVSPQTVGNIRRSKT